MQFQQPHDGHANALPDDRPLYRPLKNSQRLRLQDKELQEVVDNGMCLSMHQPYASLLVSGIKMYVGKLLFLCFPSVIVRPDSCSSASLCLSPTTEQFNTHASLHGLHSLQRVNKDYAQLNVLHILVPVTFTLLQN